MKYVITNTMKYFEKREVNKCGLRDYQCKGNGINFIINISCNL